MPLWYSYGVFLKCTPCQSSIMYSPRYTMVHKGTLLSSRGQITQQLDPPSQASVDRQSPSQEEGLELWRVLQDAQGGGGGGCGGRRRREAEVLPITDAYPRHSWESYAWPRRDKDSEQGLYKDTVRLQVLQDSNRVDEAKVDETELENIYPIFCHQYTGQNLFPRSIRWRLP